MDIKNIFFKVIKVLERHNAHRQRGANAPNVQRVGEGEKANNDLAVGCNHHTRGR